MAIPKSKKFTKFSIIPVLILPFILILQFVGEERFYRNNNILFDNVIDVNNYYFLLTFLNLLLICAVFNELLTYRFNEIINYIPFLFLITGTYTGSNLNFYFILGALLGLHQITISALNSEKIFSYADYIYFVFSIFWVNNKSSSNYYFDTDKLRGFINSSSSTTSKIYWILMFYLIAKGIFYFLNQSRNSLNFSKIKNSFLITGSLVVIFGYLVPVALLLIFSI